MSTIATEPIVPAAGPADVQPDAQGALLARVLDALDREGLAYCLLHGYEEYPQRVRSDVDCVMPREMLPRGLADLLRRRQREIGARIVQWIEDRAHFIVLAAENATGAPVTLQLHVSSDFEVENRVIYSGAEILRTRQRNARGLWVPAPHVEFAMVLTNRVAKQSIEERHAHKLSEIWEKYPQKCGEEVFRWFGRGGSVPIIGAARSGDWEHISGVTRALRRDFLITSLLRQPLSVAARWLGTQGRRIGRWLAPRSGMHIVFLGPDGVGKSTVIDAVREQIAPVFRRVQYQTFARSLLPNKPKESPHALPPRSLPASLAKAAWWLCCYTLGYYKSIHPTKARGGVAINHRYLIDAIVDPKRYRYSGPIELLRGIWRVVPKPDLLIFLDAPAEVIQQRKQEVVPAEVVRMRDAYRALAAETANAVVVDTNQPIDATVAQVTRTVLDHMSARVQRRMKS